MSNTNQRINYSQDGTIVYILPWDSGMVPNGTVGSTDLTILEKIPNLSATTGLALGGMVFNFPGVIQLTSIALMHNAPSDKLPGQTIWVSSNSTNGYDGTWTVALPDTGVYQPWTLTEFSITPTNCTWMRIYKNDLHYNYPYTRFCSLHLFGEYQGSDERFQFWNAAGNAQLTGHYPLDFPQSTMLSDYNEVKSFTIKNITDSAHTYAISITSLTAAADSLISNYWRLSLDGGTTKAPSITTPSVAAGAISGPITVCANFLKTQNPGDGYHYWYISVAEV